MAFPTLLTISDWFRRAKPNATIRDLRVQTGCHFEEVAEMLLEMDGSDSTTRNLIAQTYAAVHNLAEILKSSQHFGDFTIKNHTKFLDALCDQIVTATGVGVFAKYKIDAALDMVNRSNWSKFDDNGDAILDPNGKVMKGQDYWKPDLVPFVYE